MHKASIVTIGDELLIGQVIDTNSAWIAQELTKHGISVCRRLAIGDDATDIKLALDEATLYSDIILITGGLGPTADDITKPTLCDYFGGKMVTSEVALANVKRLFSEVFKRPLTERNLLQAQVPDVCEILNNEVGTAPGMLFNKNEKIFVSMPGVPFEMQRMLSEQAIPYILKKFSFGSIAHKTLVTYGIGESNLADMLIDFENSLPTHIKLAYLPNNGLVRLRLSGQGEDATTLQNELNLTFETLQKTAKEFIIATEDIAMPEIVGRMLSTNNETMSTAESCTGGFMAHLLTLVPGASSWFEGSAVSYSYKAKEDLLGVSKETLMKYGAVSSEVVTEMANGALNALHSTYTIAVSGIMGPGGGMPDKPVGMVWVAVGRKGKIMTRVFNFRANRKRNIELTAVNALNFLRVFMVEEKPTQ